MRDVEGITREHIGNFLGLRCHGWDERVWEDERVSDKKFERRIRLREEMGEKQGFCRERGKCGVKKDMKRMRRKIKRLVNIEEKWRGGKASDG